MFTVALLTAAKTWKQLKCPLTDEWMKNMCKYISKMEYYSVMKKNEIVPCSNMDRPRDYHTK